MAILMDHVQAVLSALKAQKDYCFIGDGQEVLTYHLIMYR